ncbi:hypothetical protein [Noviherbaspirillum soli]|uniref:hypothetical protein n=1 Tax=Noviherbaspirillum soli TaxID=1064518 RepID=UPI00188B2C65|nr:hypothetical protein [Noviherbaspirillum soli]
MSKLPLFCLLTLSLFANQAGAEDDEARLRALDQKCEVARAKRLAPIREEMARRCVAEKRYLANPEQDCRLEMSTYGDTFQGPRGAAIKGKFYDLPECLAAASAWKEWEASRPWKN